VLGARARVVAQSSSVRGTLGQMTWSTTMRAGSLLAVSLAGAGVYLAWERLLIAPREPASALAAGNAAPLPVGPNEASLSAAPAPVVARAPDTVEAVDTVEESARMLAAEPGLADLLEDLDSPDPAVRGAAQQALEAMDLQRLRENVTKPQR
jgi:hypothetical protein